jgi:hypothetical protein
VTELIPAEVEMLNPEGVPVASSVVEPLEDWKGAPSGW